MIKNRRSAVPAIGFALLIMGAGQSHAQTSPNLGQQGSAEQSDLCAGVGLAKAAMCRASGESTRSKYNLLYADDAPATDNTLSTGEDARSGRRAGRTPTDAPRSSLPGGAPAS